MAQFDHSRMDQRYILIVDDDPGIHTLLNLVFRRLPLDLKSAFDGREALDMVGSNRPGLMMLDLEMPVMDGYELLTRLGQAEDTADIPVIIFSGSADFANIAGYTWPSQVIDVVEKTSFTPATLCDRVEQCLLCIPSYSDA
jgi:CheY-like chemotaxis protein